MLRHAISTNQVHMYSSKAEAYPNRRRRVSLSNCGDRKGAMTRYITSVSAVSRGVEQGSFMRDDEVPRRLGFQCEKSSPAVTFDRPANRPRLRPLGRHRLETGHFFCCQYRNTYRTRYQHINSACKIPIDPTTPHGNNGHRRDAMEG